jgi:hypothetical protein
MKTKSIVQYTFVLLWLIVVAGCVTTPTQRAERLVTPLPKLTAAVDALVRYPDPAYPVPDDQLVAVAIKDLPGLQKAFAGYPIKVWHDAKNVVILVCSPDGKYAWLEDASWTAGVVDHKWYLSNPPTPAEFTMDPARKTKP